MTPAGLHQMDLEKLNELPFLFQIVTGFGLFVGGLAIAVLGWLKKNYKISSVIEHSGDAVVLNAAVADSQQLARLATAIGDLITFLKDREEDADRHNNRIVHNLADICEAVERQTKVFKDRTIM